MRITRIACFLLTVSCQYLTGQEFRFDRIEGLSQSVVNCILQDSKGFMWFGTQSSLNRYDGYSVTVFKNNPLDSISLSYSFVNCLHEDRDGVLWVGTDGGGLNAYDHNRNTFRAWRNAPSDSTSLSNDKVSVIREDTDGLLWVGTNGGGLCSFSKKTEKFTRYVYTPGNVQGIKGNQITDIGIDPYGILWITTDGGGLTRFDKRSGVFVTYQYSEQNEPGRGLSSDRLLSVHPDRAGKIWIGSSTRGINVFDPVSLRFESFSTGSDAGLCNDRVTSILDAGDGRLWVATYDGLSIYDRQTGKFRCVQHEEDYEHSLSDPQVRCLYKDRAGSIWVGTNAGGVCVHHKAFSRFRHFRKEKDDANSLSKNNIFSFCEVPGGKIWIGTVGGGISVWDRADNRFRNIVRDGPEGLKHESVLSLHCDNDGIVWAGTWGGGLNAWQPSTGKFVVYTAPPDLALKETGNYINHATVFSITQDAKGNIWAGTFGGVNIFDKTTRKFSYLTRDDGLSDNVVLSLLRDSEGIMWIGTRDGGVNRYDPATGEVRTYRHSKDENSISNNTVFAIHEDRNGQMWFATENGLNRFDRETETFGNFYEAHGLPSNVIFGIVEDAAGNLWLSTIDNGISRLTPSTGNGGVRFRNYDKDDGLQGNEFNQGAYLRTSEGEILFGGVKGLSAFHPHEIRDNQHRPPVLITSFKLFGKEVSLDSSITEKDFIKLDWRDRFISFEFVGLDFIKPSKNRYQYRMDGLEEDWQPATTMRFVNYSNLHGGHYVFRVRASNNDGVWNEEEARVYLYIEPPFWETNWFYALCVIVSLSGVFGFIRWRTSRIQKEKKVLEAKVADRTRELAQKNKDITSSIQYAQRIQEAILPSREKIFSHFPDAFILYRPKDIVSGDFYWFAEKNGYDIIAAVDCTGHGVPGAFMSMIGNNLLNQIVIGNNMVRPAEVLNSLNRGVQQALKQGADSAVETADGMDVAICAVDKERKELHFAGAYRPLYLFSGGQFHQVNGNKYPIGGVQVEKERVFSNHKVGIAPGDAAYLFSDGYVDQFGGEKGKKFMSRRLREILLGAQGLSMREQGHLLGEKLDEWRSSEEQIDDILVIGIRF